MYYRLGDKVYLEAEIVGILKDNKYNIVITGASDWFNVTIPENAIIEKKGAINELQGRDKDIS